MVDNDNVGSVDEKTVGATKDGLIHVVFCEKARRSAFTEIQMVINFSLFPTVSLSDALRQLENTMHLRQPLQST